MMSEERFGSAYLFLRKQLAWDSLGLLILFICLRVDYHRWQRWSYFLLAVSIITLLLFVGATGKSAQIPLYVWLPDAMEGPTPVSALIHAATMVTAGVYLIARSAALFSLSPVASLTVAVVGALTAIFAATIGLKQWDIKKVLAYSTVSQLGYMMTAIGAGAAAAGFFHLLTHGLFKALLFFGAGSVLHATGTREMSRLGGLWRAMPWTASRRLPI